MFLKKAKLRKVLRKWRQKFYKQKSTTGKVNPTKTEMTNGCENHDSNSELVLKGSSQDTSVQSSMSKCRSFDDPSVSSYSTVPTFRSKSESPKRRSKMVNEDQAEVAKHDYLVIREHQLYPSLSGRGKSENRKIADKAYANETHHNFFPIKEHKLSENVPDTNFNWVNEMPEVLVDDEDSDTDSVGSLELLMEHFWYKDDSEEISLSESNMDQQLQIEQSDSMLITVMNSFCHG
mmetsp:Transcript_9170/g.14095  ORF Transcript_9170/g.14095 Transcript_9170/m.14095 type:complete len:234 (-) Transcript_9170:160-861(-)|eukprot:CAMPEP_0178900648 /NCGR_PEP_ID=MMETSP0786-20121207/3583_1 /TAXON_ID=186022 /ORGANISM="Thalassionema frauenfeldii, Strain CCMP 1798" /LENGTH=233 /DNA_ID=CAMNT_0020571661 /DNA_START=108 /DNA_END=809 /DNA_ORIENTATION=-